MRVPMHVRVITLVLLAALVSAFRSEGSEDHVGAVRVTPVRMVRWRVASEAAGCSGYAATSCSGYAASCSGYAVRTRRVRVFRTYATSCSQPATSCSSGAPTTVEMPAETDSVATEPTVAETVVVADAAGCDNPNCACADCTCENCDCGMAATAMYTATPVTYAVYTSGYAADDHVRATGVCRWYPGKTVVRGMRHMRARSLERRAARGNCRACRIVSSW